MIAADDFTSHCHPVFHEDAPIGRKSNRRLRKASFIIARARRAEAASLKPRPNCKPYIQPCRHPPAGIDRGGRPEVGRQKCRASQLIAATGEMLALDSQHPPRTLRVCVPGGLHRQRERAGGLNDAAA